MKKIACGIITMALLALLAVGAGGLYEQKSEAATAAQLKAADVSTNSVVTKVSTAQSEQRTVICTVDGCTNNEPHKHIRCEQAGCNETALHKHGSTGTVRNHGHSKRNHH